MADRQFYDAKGNLPGERDIAFKFFVDAANPPTLAPSPLNQYISSVSRVTTGQYRITLLDSFRYHVNTGVDLTTRAGGELWPGGFRWPPYGGHLHPRQHQHGGESTGCQRQRVRVWHDHVWGRG